MNFDPHLRTGARDDIMAGKSTLLVEMEEASHILNHATERSLVLMDELGRGTATRDGSAIAKAALQYLLASTRCFTVFITHFRSLPSLADAEPGLKNGHMGYARDPRAVYAGEDDRAVLLLYRLVDGPTSSSFGLNVARWAGLSADLVGEAELYAGFYEALAEAHHREIKKEAE